MAGRVNSSPSHSFLVRMLPKKWQEKLHQRTGLLAVLDNVGWLLIDKALRLSVGFVVGVWLARYLGPEQFGEFNYALAVVMLIGAVTGLGLQSVVVRELVTEQGAAPEVLGTAGALMAAAGLAAALGCTLWAHFGWGAGTGESVGLWVPVLSWMLLFKAADVVRYRFEASIQSRFVVFIESSIMVATAAVRAALLYSGASLKVFVWLATLESAAVAVGLLALQQWKGGTFDGWRLRWSRAQVLMHDAWPLMLSGLAVMLYMRIDQLMIGRMIGSDGLGIYSAAVRLSEIWYMVPLAVASSTLPKIIESKARSQSQYEHRLMQLFAGLVAVSLAAAVLTVLFSGPVVLHIFGKAYAQASPILALHIWTGIFVSLGVVSGGWYLAENRPRLALVRTLFGAVVNVIANTVLIPRMGILGAAWGTLLAQIGVGYMFDAFSPVTRGLFRMKTRALFTFYLYARR